jgi:hypothetical protein
MAIDILQIAPPSEKSETIPFGGDTLTIRPMKMAQIARIAQRFEGFRNVYFGTGFDEKAYRAAAMIEAYPAIVCAGLGKDGKPDSHLVEAHIAKFDDDDVSAVAQAIMRLTNGEPDEEKKDDAKDPLPAGAAGSQDAGADASISTTSS